MLVSSLRKFRSLRPNFINITIFLVLMLPFYFVFVADYGIEDFTLRVFLVIISAIILFPTIVLSFFACPGIYGCSKEVMIILAAIVSYLFGCFANSIYLNRKVGASAKIKEEVKVEKQKRVRPNLNEYFDAIKMPLIILILMCILDFILKYSYGSSKDSILSSTIYIILLYLIPLIVMGYIGFSSVKKYNWDDTDAAFIALVTSLAIDIFGNFLAVILQLLIVKNIGIGLAALHFFVEMLAGIPGIVVYVFLAKFVAYELKILKTRKNELIEDAIFIIILILIFIAWFYSIYIPSTKQSYHGGVTQCSFPAGFTCITWKLYTNGNLYLKIGQGTGKTINITGFRCTTNASYVPGGVVNFSFGSAEAPGNPISNFIFPSASQIVVSDPSIENINFSCTLNDSWNAAPGAIGSTYTGKLYINYTETDTGIQKIIVGSIAARYEI